jgi:aspartate/methionine/tyrosine aminotransferase
MQKPVSPIAPFLLERYFARWEFNAPYLLCSSDIQGCPLKDLLALADPEARALWDELTLGYTETPGHPLLRQEIAGLYESVSPEEVICFAGAEEALYVAQRVLLREGDHVIAGFPGYQSSYQVAEAIGAQVSRWMLRPERAADGGLHWAIDLDELRHLLRPNTRLILVNFPHNPTGALPSPAEWAELVRIADEAGCYLFSDEVYRLMEYNPAERLAAAVDRSDKALSLGVMSKPFGLAGLRIGWLALRDRSLREQIASYKDYTTICNSAPSEILAIIGLRAKETLLRRSLDLIRRNRALVEETFRELSDYFEWIPPRAGSIAFPRWLGRTPVETFTDALVQAEGVLLLPGTVYEYPGSHFRLGLGRENIPQALERLKRFVQHLSE